MRWPDIEALLVERLPELLPAADGVATSTPGNLDGLAFVRVTIAPGGTDDGFNDTARVDVEAFAPTREGASELAEDTRRAMLALAASDTSADGSKLIDRVITVVRPYWVNYRNPAIHRFVATYQLTTRVQ